MFTVERKLVGGYVPPELAEYFAMFCIVGGTNKSVVLQKLLEDFLADKPSYKDLVADIGEQIYKEWDKKERPTDQKSEVVARHAHIFLNDIRRQLTKKKLHEEGINEIIAYASARILDKVDE